MAGQAEELLNPCRYVVETEVESCEERNITNLTSKRFRQLGLADDLNFDLRIQLKTVVNIDIVDKSPNTKQQQQQQQ